MIPWQVSQFVKSLSSAGYGGARGREGSALGVEAVLRQNARRASQGPLAGQLLPSSRSSESWPSSQENPQEPLAKTDLSAVVY